MPTADQQRGCKQAEAAALALIDALKRRNHMGDADGGHGDADGGQGGEASERGIESPESSESARPPLRVLPGEPLSNSQACETKGGEPKVRSLPPLCQDEVYVCV
jgi:hypothetical protein